MSVEQEARSLLAAACPDMSGQLLRGTMASLNQLPVAVDVALNAITAALLRSSASRDEVIEEAAKVCEQQAQDFLSPEYATSQPLSSLQERFACNECAKLIRAMKEPS